MALGFSRNSLITIVGATGTGKSNVSNLIKDICMLLTVKLAVFLAERYNGEIINGDALQLYEGLPITTNKITFEERKGIAHHLLGCISLKEPPWTVARFAFEAGRTIEQIKARGKMPILVGGTNYYTQALLFAGHHIDQDANFVANLEGWNKWPILQGSNKEILQELQRVDPAMAARWHPNDIRKIRRSLEIWLQTGRKASDIYAQQRIGSSALIGASTVNGPDIERQKDTVLLNYDSLIFWVYSEPEILNARLAKRVDDMVINGLLTEVQCMNAWHRSQLDCGMEVDTSRGIWAAIGYKEFEEYLRAIELQSSVTQVTKSRNIGIEKTIIATRQYAKRQVRWIRLKLMVSLKKAGVENKMFVLDSSQANDWSSEVEQKASKVIDNYVAGMTLPDPRTLSRIASSMLSNELLAKPGFSLQRRLCELCGVNTTTAKDWEQHLRSKKHRYMLRKKISET